MNKSGEVPSEVVAAAEWLLPTCKERNPTAMRLTLLLVVAAAASLLSSCNTLNDSLAGSSTASLVPRDMSGQQGGDISRARGSANRPFTGPSLPSARFNTSKGRYGFGGDYSVSRPNSLVTTYDPENFLMNSPRCYRYRHCGSSYGHYGSSCGYRSSCGGGYGGYSRGCRY